MRETSNYSISRTAEVRDPYARWCGRGEAVRLPPIPINMVFNKERIKWI